MILTKEQHQEPSDEQERIAALKSIYYSTMVISETCRNTAERVTRELKEYGEQLPNEAERMRAAAVYRNPEHTLQDIVKAFMPEADA